MRIFVIKLFLFQMIFLSGISSAKAQYATPDSIVTYVDFIKNQQLSAKEYLLGLFNRYDIVVFGERTHDEFTQYELLKDLFSDERFYSKVGDIFMEIGGSNFDGEINQYLLSPNLTIEQSRQKALEIQRNAAWYPLWERYNYHYLLTSLYEINRNLPVHKKLKLHPTDIAADWKEIKNEEDVNREILNLQDSRDSVMAKNIISYINKNSEKENVRKKYFLILNMPHASRGTLDFGDVKTKSAASYIFDEFPNSTANILINIPDMRQMISSNNLPAAVPIIDGKLDAAFEYVGIDDLGFDIKSSPLDGLPFDNFMMDNPSLTNEQVFTGYVFYKSYPGQEHINGVPGIINDEYLPELKRRYSIWPYHASEQQIRAYNAAITKKPADLISYWQKVIYWSGGGKPILGFYNTKGSIDETIQFILREREKGSDTYYNISEIGMNDFGYALAALGKENDALKIFKLNTELYPNASNTYDSYGEMLLKLGRTEEAKTAYRKALDLNPENVNAKRVLNLMGW